MNQDFYFVWAISLSALAVVIAFAALLFDSFIKVRNDRRERTHAVIISQRLNDYWQNRLAARRVVWAEGQPISQEEFFRYLSDPAFTAAGSDSARRRNQAALAVREILNYYEFMANGIVDRSLDERALKRSIRGMMCNFVNDCREIIIRAQKDDPRLYENLAEVYNRWRDPTMPALPRPSSPIATFGIPTIIRR